MFVTLNFNPKKGNKTDMTVPPERLKELEHLHLLDKVQTELLAWAKKRFWILGILGLFLATIGPTALVSVVIGDRLDSRVANAIEATTQAKSTLKTANESLSKAKSLVSEVEKLRRVAKEVNKEFLSLRAKLEASSANVRDESASRISNLQEQINKLGIAFSEIAKSDKLAKDAVENLRLALVQTQKAGKEREKEFAANSRFDIEVHFKKADSVIGKELVSRLRKRGFIVEEWVDISHKSLTDIWGISIDTTLSKAPIIAFTDEAKLKVQELSKYVSNVLNVKEVSIQPIDSESKGLSRILKLFRRGKILILLPTRQSPA